MSTSTRWWTAIGLILGLMAVGCGGNLPPIVIGVPALEPTPAPEPAPIPKPRATLAFQVVDACSGTYAVETIVTVKDGPPAAQVNGDGYVAFELEHGRYDVSFEAIGYVHPLKSYIVSENRQWRVTLDPLKGCAPEPTVPSPKPEPPVVTPAPPAPAVDSIDWTDEQWKQAFFALLKKHKAPRTVNLQTLNDTRADIEALGAEWQHYSSGELRPRLYLPVPPGADIYSRPVDVGLYGEPWAWVKR